MFDLIIYFEILVSALLAEHLLVFFLFCQWCFRFVVSCVPSWFWGPVVTLQDCLAAFFARDELKGKRLITWTCFLGVFFLLSQWDDLYLLSLMQLSRGHLLECNTVNPCSFWIIHFRKVSFSFNWLFEKNAHEICLRNVKSVWIWFSEIVSTEGS